MPEASASEVPNPVHRVLDVLATLSYRSGELNDFLDRLASGVAGLLRMDWAVVTLLSEQEAYQVVGSSEPLDQPDQIYSLHGGVAGTVVHRGCQVTVEDTRLAPEQGRLPEGYLAYLGTPLRLPDDQIIGTLCIFHRERQAIGPDQRQIAGLFAERAAIAIDNFHLYQQQQRFNQRLKQEVAERSRELLAAQQTLVETETLRAIGEFATGIVHEIRSPLSSINLVLQYIAGRDLGEPARKRVELGSGEARRLERLLNEILLYAKPQDPRLTSLDPDTLIRTTLATLTDSGQNSFDYRGTAGHEIQADPDKLTQVLINLLNNACEAAPGLVVGISLDHSPDDGQLWLRVHNAGPPIPAADLERLTQPFFTTQAGGTGLGLAIVRRIVEAHHGRLDITSSAQDGTVVTVTLPAA